MFGILSSFSIIIRTIVGCFPTLVVYGEGKGLGKSGATSSMLHGFSSNETRKFQETIDATHVRQAVSLSGSFAFKFPYFCLFVIWYNLAIGW